MDLPSHSDAVVSLLTLAEQFDDNFALRRFASPQPRVLHTKLWVVQCAAPTAHLRALQPHWRRAEG